MNLQLDIDFVTPSPMQQQHGQAMWGAGSVTRFSKVLGQRNTYRVTLQTVTDNHVEDVVGDAMNEIRRGLPDFNPNSVRMVGCHVSRTGPEAHQ